MIKPLTTVIFENDSTNLAYLNSLLELCFPEITVLGTVDNTKDGLKMIEDVLPDFIFLDVELNNGSGFDLLEDIQDYNIKVITCTSHEKYAFEAYSHHIFGFLLKPFDMEKFVKLVRKVQKQIAIEEAALAADQKENDQAFANYIGLSSTKEAIVLKPDHINYLKAEGRYTSIFLNDGNTRMVAKNLGMFEKILNPAVFFRIHHKYIVNLDRVVAVDRPTATFCTLDNGKELPISQRKSSQLEKYLFLRN